MREITLGTVRECIAAGLKVYEFGSGELAKLHEWAEDPPELVVLNNGCPLRVRRYAWRADGLRYVVCHGPGHYTLNTIKAGACSVEMRDVIDDTRGGT